MATCIPRVLVQTLSWSKDSDMSPGYGLHKCHSLKISNLCFFFHKDSYCKLDLVLGSELREEEALSKCSHLKKGLVPFCAWLTNG